MIEVKDPGHEEKYVMEASSYSGLEKLHLSLGMAPSINLYHIDIVSCEFSTWEALSKVGVHQTLCNCLQQKEHKQELIFSWFGRDAPLLYV